MRSNIIVTLKILVAISILPIASIFLTTTPSTNLRDFSNLGEKFLAYYWGLPVGYIFSITGVPAFAQTNIIINFLIEVFLPFTSLCAIIYWMIRKIFQSSSNQALQQSIIVAIVILEIPGFIMTTLMINAHSSSYPVYFRNIYISPSPIVGRVSKLYVEIESKQNESEVDFSVDFFEEDGNKIHLVSGLTNWHGDLIANQPKVFVMEICITQEGVWPIDLSAGSIDRPFIDYEIIHIDSTLEHGVLIRSRNYTYSQEEAARRPTPRPIDVSVECSGK